MEITAREYCSLFEVTVESGNAKITEDISQIQTTRQGGFVPEDEIEQFIAVAYEANRFNGASDVDFVYKIFDAFLNDSEREQFIEIITTKQD